jgi:hypothetical protein
MLFGAVVLARGRYWCGQILGSRLVHHNSANIARIDTKQVLIMFIYLLIEIGQVSSGVLACFKYSICRWQLPKA